MRSSFEEEQSIIDIESQQNSQSPSNSNNTEQEKQRPVGLLMIGSQSDLWKQEEEHKIHPIDQWESQGMVEEFKEEQEERKLEHQIAIDVNAIKKNQNQLKSTENLNKSSKLDIKSPQFYTKVDEKDLESHRLDKSIEMTQVNKNGPVIHFNKIKDNQMKIGLNGLGSKRFVPKEAKVLSGLERVIYQRLIAFGYDNKMVKKVMELYKINSMEQGIDYLVKGEKFWIHPYIHNTSKSRCTFCKDKKINHKQSRYKYENKLIPEDDYDSKECGICYSQISLEDIFILKCGHIFCEGCLKEFVNFQVMNGNVSKLMCPWGECQVDISQKSLQKHLMSQEEYKKYERFVRVREIQKNPNLKECPSVDCEGIFRKPRNNPKMVQQSNLAQCNKCKKIYCYNCLHENHQGLTCEQVLDKDFQEWAGPNSDIDMCRNCKARIQKDGGCPNMTCFLCKQEWCWECKQNFPVHNPDCPYYYKYLEILEFQGISSDLPLNSWYSVRGSSGPLFFIAIFLLLLVIGLPGLILANILITPCYVMMMVTNCCKINKQRFQRWYNIILLIFLGIFLYVAIPFTFIIITIPQIIFFFGKLILELKDLIKNRCRRYKRLSVSPIMNKYLDTMGLY